MSAPVRVLEPGATIGILGSGQLGRMLALEAAARLGFKCHVFAPDRTSPAFDVVQQATFADYTDTAALDRFADNVDVVTYEFENVPAEAALFSPRAFRCCPIRKSWRSPRIALRKKISSRARHRYRAFAAVAAVV